MLEDKNKFAEMHHSKIKELGYWNRPRETGTLLMLMVTEITKLFDKNKLNKPEKLADLALRIYDYCGYHQIDLTDLPGITSCSLWDMVSVLTNELESYRAGFNSQGLYVKQCLSMAYKYAETNSINLDEEITKKYNMLDQVKKRLI